MLNIKHFQELCRRVEEEREPTKLHETTQQMIEMLEEQDRESVIKASEVMAGAKKTSKYALMIQQTDLGNQTDSTTRKNRPHAQTLYRHAQPRMHCAEPIANVGKPYVRYRTRLIRCTSLRVEPASSPAAVNQECP